MGQISILAMMYGYVLDAEGAGGSNGGGISAIGAVLSEIRLIV
jgi:hypothetical protein